MWALAHLDIRQRDEGSMRVSPTMFIQGITTGELLDELELRNKEGQGNIHNNSKEQVVQKLRKLRLAFSLRNGGLDYKRMDQ